MTTRPRITLDPCIDCDTTDCKARGDPCWCECHPGEYVPVHQFGERVRLEYKKRPKPSSREGRRLAAEAALLYRKEHGHAPPRKRRKPSRVARIDEPENRFVFEGVIAKPPFDGKEPQRGPLKCRRMCIFTLAHIFRAARRRLKHAGTYCRVPIAAFGDLADLVLSEPWESDRVLRVEGYATYSIKKNQVIMVAQKITTKSLGERNKMPAVDEALAKLIS